MNDDLVKQLLVAETDFLDSLQNDPKMLVSYRQSLSALPTALSTAAKMGAACDKTLSLAHSVASRILNIATCYLRVRHEEEDFAVQLRVDCDAMLHQMDALNLNAQPKSKHLDSGLNTQPLPLTVTPDSDTGSSSPPFPAAAYGWLLGNLHNPYPTTEVKTQIAAASSCQVSSINSWFINARRRIGWTTLCRERFSSRRADMIDAAYRALVGEDPQRALSPELRHSFVAMRVAAEDLYSSTHTRSVSAGDLHALLKDTTERNGEPAEIGKRRQVEQTDLTNLKAVQDSYPSPDPSITVSPAPTLSDSLTDESGEDQGVAPLIIAGSKRRRSSMEPVDPPSSAATRPIKRLRASMTSRTCLPSPPSSTHSVDEAPDHSSPERPVNCMLPETNKVSPSHKRRLSDADATGTPKRSCDSMVVPCPHTLSDPLPRPNIENEYSIDDWFNTNFDALFDIPPPVDAIEPDFSALWEVELFKDYSIPGNSKYTPKCLPLSADTPPADLSDLDSLLRSIDGHAFVAPPDGVLSSNAIGAPYATSLNSSIRDISQTSIDWMLLLNNAEAYQPAVCSTFPQYLIDSQPLPGLDLSMLQLPRAMPPVNFQGDFASKQVKLQQLHAMQEAVWRMEQELRSEGVVI